MGGMNSWPYPFWIAHRGAGKLAPENTLAAFRVGACHGYRAFECDVKLSADGVPFLLHDETLRRTTCARGLAGQRPWAELARLDAGRWHSPGYAGEPLPSFEAIATYCVSHDFALNVELKPTPGADEHTGRVVAHAAARLWRDSAVKPLLSSFRPDALAAAQSAEPALPRALLFERLCAGWLEQARELACVALVADHEVLDARAIARIHAAGMRALCYTVNDPVAARRLLAAGIDGIITDAVDRFAPADRDVVVRPV
jgi:glycerophosphoryl diester phosphodiesterase